MGGSPQRRFLGVMRFAHRNIWGINSPAGGDRILARGNGIKIETNNSLRQYVI